MATKGHLISESFEEIMSLRANLNLGMSDRLKHAFPNIVLVARPKVPLLGIIDPQWLTGFILFFSYFT